MEQITLKLYFIVPLVLPDAPVITSVEGVEGSPQTLEVEWTEPEDNLSAIIDYDVRYRLTPTGNNPPEEYVEYEPNADDSTDLTITMEDLLPASSYDVQVRAGNDVGEGAWSDFVSGQTSNAPPVINSITTDADDDTITTIETLTISVDAEDIENDPISYTFTFPDLPAMEIDIHGILSQADSNMNNERKYTPPNTPGTYRVQVEVSDGIERPDLTTTTHVDDITITVEEPVNLPPIINSITTDADDDTITTLETLTVTVDAEDLENDPISYDFRLPDAPNMDQDAHGILSQADSNMSNERKYTPPDTPAIYYLEVEVGDGIQRPDLTTTTHINFITIRVEEHPNLAPVIISFNASPFNITVTEFSELTVMASDTEDDTISFDYTFVDEDGDELTDNSEDVVGSLTFVSNNVANGVTTNVQEYEPPSEVTTIYIKVVASDSDREDETLEEFMNPSAIVTINVGGERPDAPDMPDVNTVDDNEMELEIEWAEPEDNGHSITGYQLEYRVASEITSEIITLTGIATTHVIDGLTRNTTYQVRVQAGNTIDGVFGYGDWSDIGEGKTKYINNAPVIVSFTADPPSITTDEISTLTVIATDEDSDDLGYSFSVATDELTDEGHFSGDVDVLEANQQYYNPPSTTGTYTVTVTVTDNPGNTLNVPEGTEPLSTEATVDIAVEDIVNLPPIINSITTDATDNRITILETLTISVDAEDAENDPIAYTFSFPDAPSMEHDAHGTLSQADSLMSNERKYTPPDTPGFYRVQVEVGDGIDRPGLETTTHIADITIIVAGAENRAPIVNHISLLNRSTPHDSCRVVV